MFLLFEQKEEEHCTPTLTGDCFCVKFFSEARLACLDCFDAKIHTYSFPQKTVQSEVDFVASEQDIHGINKDIFLDLHMCVIARPFLRRGDLLYIRLPRLPPEAGSSQ